MLSPKLIELAAAPDDEIRLLEQAERGPNDDIDDHDEGMPPSTGAIFAWQSSDQLGSLGILHVILALILMVGGVIGAQFGALAGQRLKGEQLRFLLAGLVLMVCIRIGWSLVARPDEFYSIAAAIGRRG